MIIDNIKFKQILKDKKLNKTKLSETLKISTKTIAKISKGENLSDKIVNKIAAFLNVGENDLIKTTSLLDHLKQEKEVNLNGRIYEELQVKLTTNTNFVENINLTEDDVRFVYTTQRIACANECIKIEDIIETFNHFKCIDYCIDHAEEPISEEFIKQLHIILKQGTMQTYKYGSGVYKEYENVACGKSTTPPQNVKTEIKKLFFNYSRKKKFSFEDLVIFHYNFEKIHPFQDGNGRIGRLIMFKECLKNNIVPTFVDNKNKHKYINAFLEYENDKTLLIKVFKQGQEKIKELLNYFKIEY